MKKVIAVFVLLLMIGNEVISLAALCVLAGWGLVAFLKASAKGGAFDD